MPAINYRMEIQLETGKKLYFVSDSHLGIPTHSESLRREKLLVEWLDFVKPTAAAIFLLGDIFEFWFEYKSVVPKGFVRLLGKLAEITDSGVQVYFFTGNHDIWTFGYLENEVGLQVVRSVTEFSYSGKTFLIGHGDGLGPGDNAYKLAKKCYESPLLQRIFAWFHPVLGLWLASKFSKKDRYTNGSRKNYIVDPDNDRIIVFCKDVLKTKKIDYFIFGHRHTPCDIVIGTNARYINTGDWINHFSFASFDGTDAAIHKNFASSNLLSD